MNKKIAILLIFPIAYLSISTPASAQTKKLESTLEGVKDKVENLVTAKDEESVSELALRIETFKKVIDFSVSETKDFKVKLLALDGLSKEEIVWRDGIIKDFNSFLELYENREKAFEDALEIDLEGIKSLAADFKAWRDETYLPVAERVNEFLLIHQEEKAVEIAVRRWTRINEDIKKLEKAKIKGVDKLRELLSDAEGLIGEGQELNEKAALFFWENYIITSTSTATSTASSTDASSTTITKVSKEAAADTDNAALSKEEIKAEDASSTPQISQPPSIKDLVEDSLVHIKDAYRIFIEMSNLVRELLK